MLFRQEACLLAHAQNPLVRKERIRLADLEGFVWLLPPQGTPSRMAINEAFAAAGLSAARSPPSKRGRPRSSTS